MALFSYHADFVSRGKGQSATASAAYNNGLALDDPKDGLTKDYTRKEGVLYSAMIAPKNAPTWARAVPDFVRRLEAAEDKSTRRDEAVMFRKVRVALPYELVDVGEDGKKDITKCRFLVEDICRETWGRQGYAVNYAIHDADPDGDPRNVHAHILVPLRKIEGGAFAAVKLRLGEKELVAQTMHEREKVANLTNHALQRWGFAERVSHLSNEARGLEAPARKYQPRAEYVTQRRQKKATARAAGGGSNGAPRRGGFTPRFSATQKTSSERAPTSRPANAATSARMLGVGKALAFKPAPRTRPEARPSPIVQVRPEAQSNDPYKKFQGIARELDTWELMWREYAEFKAAGMIEAWRVKYQYQLQQLKR